MNLTILTPYKADATCSLNKCLKSYYNSWKYESPKHLVCDDSSEKQKEITNWYLCMLMADHDFIDGENSFYQAVVNLIENVKTDYFCFLIDDVELITKKNIFKDCVGFLDKNKDICQVKIGGGFISDGEDNRGNLIREDNIVRARCNPYMKYSPVAEGDNTFWTSEKLNHKRIYDMFPLSYWNCVMRTSVFKEIHEVIKDQRTPQDRTWSDYLAKSNYSTGISNDIYQKGWPKGLEFIENYKYSWLNFSNYIYAHGRQKTNIETFKKTHCEEIK